MKTFNEWLKEKDPELYDEVDWRGIGRGVKTGAQKLALATSLAGATLGGYGQAFDPGAITPIGQHDKDTEEAEAYGTEARRKRQQYTQAPHRTRASYQKKAMRR